MTHVVWVHGIGDHKAGYSDPWRMAFDRYLKLPPDSYVEVLWETVMDAPAGTRARAMPTQRELADEEAVREELRAIIVARESAMRAAAAPATPAAPDTRGRDGDVVAWPAPRGTRGFGDWLLHADEYLGDFVKYLVNRSIRTSVKERFKERLQPLIADNPGISVVAHSWGTVVAYDALCSGAVLPADLAKVQTFVTFGSALNNAWDRRLIPARTCRLRESLPTTMHWINVWSAYDPVAGGELRTPSYIRPPDEDIEVTNWMNVILDHGGYFVNREEFWSRIAQELESPGARPRSRFFPERGEEGWRARRRDRVLTLVTWRVVAILAFAAGVIVRIRTSDRLRADGEAVWAWLMTLPIVGGVVTFIDQHALWLVWGERLGARLLGIGFWLTVLGAAYVGISWLAFASWHDNAGQRSTGRGHPPASQRAIIIVSSIAMFFAIAVGIAVMIQAPALRRP